MLLSGPFRIAAFRVRTDPHRGKIPRYPHWYPHFQHFLRKPDRECELATRAAVVGGSLSAAEVKAVFAKPTLGTYH
jgi:hypothetical protein